MSLLIKGGIHCFTRECADVLIRDGKIAKISPKIMDKADKIINAEGKILYPAFSNSLYKDCQ